MIYNIATIWITLGTLVYLWHNIYVWDVASRSFKAEIVKFKFFVMAVLCFPVIACILVWIIVSVEIGFRRWKKEMSGRYEQTN